MASNGYKRLESLQIFWQRRVLLWFLSQKSTWQKLPNDKSITNLGNQKWMEFAFREVDIQILGSSLIIALEACGNVFGRLTWRTCQISCGRYSCIHIQRSVSQFLHLSSHMVTSVHGNKRTSKCKEGSAATRGGRSTDDLYNMFADYIMGLCLRPLKNL